MKIKLVDYLSFMDNSNSISELRIKIDLMYGEKFEVILNNFLQKMGYQMLPETLASMTLKDIISYLGMIGRNFEEKSKCYISKQSTYEHNMYTRYIEEYYLPEWNKYENISITI